METTTVRELAEILNTHGLTRLEVKNNDSNMVLTLEKCQAVVPLAANIPTAQPQPSPAVTASGAYTEIKSPIVGVFYSAASPDSPPFVSIGSQVKKGDVLCIIEAMKLMNEVTAEQDGEILDVCIKNGDVAEYGQVLFKIR